MKKPGRAFSFYGEDYESGIERIREEDRIYIQGFAAVEKGHASQFLCK